jgi:hypothetical protein
MGKLEEARLLLEEALQGRKETLGDNHQHTRNTIRLLDSLLRSLARLRIEDDIDAGDR